MPEDQEPFGDRPQVNPGQGDRLALLALYDAMTDAQKQELLREALRIVRVAQRP